MNFLDTLPPAAIPLAIFLLRALDLTLSTLRMLAVVRGRHLVAWILGFFGALLFITAIAGVLADLNGLSLLAYAAGYATGSYVGMTIERRLAPGHGLLRIFVPSDGEAVADALHQSGHGATWIESPRSTGGLILCYVPRRAVRQVSAQIAALAPECTISSENVRWLRGGFRA